MGPYKLIQCKLPGEQREAFVQAMLDLADASKQLSVNKMIEMTADLIQNGMESRFVKPLKGPLYELKARTSEGGARVYFFRYTRTAFVLTGAEVKDQDQADPALLDYAAEIIWHVNEGRARQVLFGKL